MLEAADLEQYLPSASDQPRQEGAVVISPGTPGDDIEMAADMNQEPPVVMQVQEGAISSGNISWTCPPLALKLEPWCIVVPKPSRQVASLQQLDLPQKPHPRSKKISKRRQWPRPSQTILIVSLAIRVMAPFPIMLPMVQKSMMGNPLRHSQEQIRIGFTINWMITSGFHTGRKTITRTSLFCLSNGQWRTTAN